MYYKIVDSLDIKEVGHFPQCEEALWDGPRFDENSFAHNGELGPLKNSPALPQPIFKKSAKQNDYICISVINRNLYKTISPSFYRFLNPFLNEHQVWCIKTSNDVYMFNRKNFEYVIKDGVKQEFYDYKILHISYPKEDFVNFEKSEFIIDTRKNFIEQVGKITKAYVNNPSHKKVNISSNSEYRVLIKELQKDSQEKKVIITKKLVFNFSKSNDEIFRLLTPIQNLSGYYVSTNLKNKIQKMGFTGMDFKPLEGLNPHVEIEII